MTQMNITHLNFGEYLPSWSVLPFIGLLISIAILPRAMPTFWSKHTLKICVVWALLFCIPFGSAFGGRLLLRQLAETVLLDYLPFIVLLFGLFSVTGGIAVRGCIIGTPKTNTAMLLLGTGLASCIGTTGAAMLMIRPLLCANAY